MTETERFQSGADDERARKRVVWVVVLLAAVAVGALAYGRWNAGRDEMASVTERVAAAITRGDRHALYQERVLIGNDAAIAWLLDHRRTLEPGYRVSLRQRWDNGTHLMPPSVTHLGVISAPSGTVYLGFRYERQQDRVEFVTASFAFKDNP